MLAWLMHIGEDLPLDGVNRAFRYGYLAEAIQRRGGAAVRWAPTLRHTTKTQRSNTDKLVKLSPGYDAQLVYAPGYRAHVGLRRLRMYRELARRFRGIAARHRRPDVIVAAIPSLEWAEQAIAYGADFGVPVVVDIRDLWPDLFEVAVPRPLRWAARPLLAGYSRLADRICNQADALVGVSPSYLRWATNRAGRPERGTDFVAPIGCVEHTVTPREEARVLDDLRRRGFDPHSPTACYLGQLARSSDLETVIRATRRLWASGLPLQVLVCGDGAKRAALEDQAAGVSGVHFLGNVDSPTMAAVMRASQVGLCAYAADATQSWPNKPFEYMASRLALVSCLPGDLQRLIDDYGLGMNYRAEDHEHLAASLSTLFADPGRLAAAREAGRSLWAERFQPEVIYASFVDHLQAIAARKSARAA